MNIIQSEEANLIPLYAKRDICLNRGEGAFVFDQNERRYLDLSSQYGAAILGYNHPQLKTVLCDQFSKIHICHGSFYNETRARFLAKLVEISNSGISNLTRAFLCSTGTETVEAALKFARVATGRTDFISCKRGYHGRTFGALSATAVPKYQQPFQPLLPGFTTVPFNNFTELEASVTTETAGIILEIIQGEGGINLIDPNYLRQVRELCTQKGILLIFDEVQTGIGRTGKWCAFHHYGVAPDILCLSKGIANGFPLGATLVTSVVSEKIPRGTHGTTFGGNPLACSAGLAVLEIIEQQNLLEKVLKNGQYLLTKLQNLNSPKIREVRGLGYMLAIDLREKAGRYLKILQQKGFIVVSANQSTVVRLLPPYLVTPQQLDDFVAVFEKLTT